MYYPHILECGSCLTTFTDGQRVYSWFEDYLCEPCTPEHIREYGGHIWKEPKADQKAS